ncbi:hypothetical protein GW17_00022533 [Ensete ventricosum]|nr:hypothetical protein GW17_00022533 [Ensete ventricosum]
MGSDGFRGILPFGLIDVDDDGIMVIYNFPTEPPLWCIILFPYPRLISTHTPMAVALRLSKPPSPLPSHHLTPSLLCYSQLFSSLQRRIASPLRCRCSKKKETSFTDQLLDYIEGETRCIPQPFFGYLSLHCIVLPTNGLVGIVLKMNSYVGGPKLRKWYGAPDLLPKDGGLENEDESSALVKDKRAALDAFGTYVEVSTCTLMDGFFSDKERTKGAQHIVLLSQVLILTRLQLAFYRGSSGIQAVMNSKARKLAERDEETVIASGIPYTIIRAGLLQDSPGGKQGFSFSEVVNGEEKVRDWKEKFAELIGTAEE